MLHSNSTKARHNIRNYIVDKFDPTNYGKTMQDFETFEDIAKFIVDTFKDEYRKPFYQSYFTEYCQGLPSVLDTCYYYNRSAVDDLAKILDETNEEKAKYTEEKAEKVLTALIYRELSRGVSK